MPFLEKYLGTKSIRFLHRVRDWLFLTTQLRKFICKGHVYSFCKVSFFSLLLTAALENVESWWRKAVLNEPWTWTQESEEEDHWVIRDLEAGELESKSRTPLAGTVRRKHTMNIKSAVTSQAEKEGGRVLEIVGSPYTSNCRIFFVIGLITVFSQRPKTFPCLLSKSRLLYNNNTHIHHHHLQSTWYMPRSL